MRMEREHSDVSHVVSWRRAAKFGPGAGRARAHLLLLCPETSWQLFLVTRRTCCRGGAQKMTGQHEADLCLPAPGVARPDD